MLASLTLDVITTFVCNTGKTNHQMNKFITLYERIVSVDLRIYRAFFRTQVMNAEYIDNLDNIGTKTQTRD